MSIVGQEKSRLISANYKERVLNWYEYQISYIGIMTTMMMTDDIRTILVRDYNVLEALSIRMIPEKKIFLQNNKL
jgi:hypothetical protein